MTLTLDLVLLIVALVCLAAAAAGASLGRIALGWLGLFFFVLTFLTP